MTQDTKDLIERLREYENDPPPLTGVPGESLSSGHVEMLLVVLADMVKTMAEAATALYALQRDVRLMTGARDYSEDMRKKAEAENERLRASVEGHARIRADVKCVLDNQQRADDMEDRAVAAEAENERLRSLVYGEKPGTRAVPIGSEVEQARAKRPALEEPTP